MFDNFINWLKDVRCFSINTVNNYARCLLVFDKYLKNSLFLEGWVEDCERITLSFINWFYLHQKNSGKDTGTCNLYLASIKNYLKYCFIEWKNVLNYNKILYGREIDKKIESVCWEDCKKLINYVKKVKVKTKRGELIKARNIAIVLFFLYSWLRVSELCNLKREDLKEKIQVIGKWWVRRTVYLWRDVLDVCNYYLRLRKDDNDSLFINHSHNTQGKLSTVSVEKMIRESAICAWCSEKIFPHKLRHTFATELLRKNVNLPTIQKLMGHKNLTTTQKYLTIEDNELRKAQQLLKF